MQKKAPTAASKAKPEPKKAVVEAGASTASKAPAKKSPAPVKAAHQPEPPPKAPIKKATTTVKAASSPQKAASAPAKAAPAPAKPAPAKAAKSKPKGDRAEFFASQKQLLLDERDSYARSAEALKAQADSLALEHEPGDVQFDEEGGEGGTATVDREMDLHLSAQARATIIEIDRALEKIADGSYGVCEQCHEPIPDARLEALPYAAMCVACKSGGLSSRR
jgi:DnaK suppressor protein